MVCIGERSKPYLCPAKGVRTVHSMASCCRSAKKQLQSVLSPYCCRDLKLSSLGVRDDAVEHPGGGNIWVIPKSDIEVSQSDIPYYRSPEFHGIGKVVKIMLPAPSKAVHFVNCRFGLRMHEFGIIGPISVVPAYR